LLGSCIVTVDSLSNKNAEQEYDVVIVGAGVAGAVVADVLTQQSIRVCMLEAGPDIRDRSIYVNRMLEGQVNGEDWPYHYHEQAPSPPMSNPDRYYEDIGPVAFDSTYERRVGGTTWHWLGNCPRFVPEDFKLNSLYGKGVDWPIGYEDIEPWYQQAENALGVAGDRASGSDPYRVTEYPRKAIPLAPIDQYFAKKMYESKASYKGVAIRLTPIPQARNGQLCMGSNSCIPICPMGAKYEAVTHIAKAESQGLTLRSKAVASKVLSAPNGNILGVEYLDWEGKTHRVKGRYYVLAANAIETPKLLLMSATSDFPKGIANRSDQVGRNLMDHPVQLGYALSKEAVYPYRGPLETGSFLHLREGEARRHRAASMMNVQNNGWVWGKEAPKTTLDQLMKQGALGTTLKKGLHDHMNRQVLFGAMLEQLPLAQNRVSLSAKTDALGLPRPRLHFEYDDYLHAGVIDVVDSMKMIFEMAGCHTWDFPDRKFGAGHLMGTTRMGTHPDTSVVDENACAHDHTNLYIVGAGIFPTGGTANPTLTLVALALRSATHLAKRLGAKGQV
jgi:choline dehydrogenase-like flavoprotein